MSHSRAFRVRSPLYALVATFVLLAALACAGPALGAANAHWSLESRTAPEYLPPGGKGVIIATATNLGDAEINGGTHNSTVVITDKLPDGVHATGVARSINSISSGLIKTTRLEELTCTKTTGAEIDCSYTGKLPPYELLQLKIAVEVEEEGKLPVDSHDNIVTVSGGEAEAESVEQMLKLSNVPASFGIEEFNMTPETESFAEDRQAGSHPFQLTTTFNLNQSYGPNEFTPGGGFFPIAPDGGAALEKELSFELPAGLIGNVNAVKQCTSSEFGADAEVFTNGCPNETVVGVASVTAYDPSAESEDYATYVVPLFNLEPSPGEPARFGFSILHVPVVLDTSVRTGDDYGVTVSVHYAAQTVQVLGSKVTFWGEPADERHNISRGWVCLNHIPERAGLIEECGTPAKAAKVEPFLMLPTHCGPNKTTVTGEVWNASTLAKRHEAWKLGEGGEPLFSAFETEGCAGLEFNPTISVKPETSDASTPTGLNVTVSVPQTGTMEPSYENKAEAAVSSTRLELPVGLQTSPAAAYGLTACGVEQAGFIGAVKEGFPEHSSAELKKETGSALEGELATQGFTPAQAQCLEAAKIGSVNIKTPLLERELTGGVYLAEQDTNPFASPLVLYLIATDKAPHEEIELPNGEIEQKSKVLVKLAGEVSINPENGQLISDFKNTPQTPFETLTLHLWNSPRASQTTPARCNTYTSKATFTNSSNTAERTAEPTFEIASGPGGAPCPGATLPFEPSFEAESTNTQAAAFTPFKLRIRRPDGDAALKTISMQLPPGLAAVLASVPLCPEPQAAEGNCSPESEIGQSVARSGLGSAPYPLSGKVYLTGPYNGAPFGLSSVTDATNVGPFQVGKIVVRSSINVNEFTAAATINTEASQFYPVESDEGGKVQFKPLPEASFEGLPERLKGVPSQIKELEVTVDRPNFEFNPTNCEKLAINGKLTGYEGTSFEASPAFKVGGCGSLPFEPKLTATVAGQGSKLGGTRFVVTVESPGLGQAGLHKVDLTLPEALPSRLTTIQKACLEVVFNANPAACDEGSVIGEGIVHTPVFKNPLKGPAYLVSHGGAAFPDVEFVLQGEGITLILDGKTDIKKGITYSHFETNPDAPFTKFESIFPAGPHSALTPDSKLAPTYNLCKFNLALPTEITGQNGAFKSLNTKIAVEGCGGVKNFKVTKAAELAKALKACRTKDKKSKKKRVACEKAARKKYGPKAKKSAKKAAKKSARK
ncbi:MAG: hypothetical protein ABSG93_03210 [Solirubrobacteraceae bacterium]|jgi:hypothetical protein